LADSGRFRYYRNIALSLLILEQISRIAPNNCLISTCKLAITSRARNQGVKLAQSSEKSALSGEIPAFGASEPDIQPIRPEKSLIPTLMPKSVGRLTKGRARTRRCVVNTAPQTAVAAPQLPALAVIAGARTSRTDLVWAHVVPARSVSAPAAAPAAPAPAPAAPAAAAAPAPAPPLCAPYCLKTRQTAPRTGK
jgi:hypothetical protein